MESPAGSPMGAQLHGAELARRMVQAAEAASQAATVAAQALNELKPKETNDWFKLVPKPNSFDPKNKEEEISLWRDWWWTVEQFLATVDSKYQSEIDTLKTKLEVEIVLTSLSSEEQKRSLFLYSLLASLLKGRLLNILKGVTNNNGYEGLRQLLQTCQPSSRNRSLGLLNAIMAWPAFSMKQPLLSQILRLEQAFREYERIASALTEEIRFAVLLRCVGGQLKTFLNVNISDSSSYSELREAILRYDRANVRWTESMALGFEQEKSEAIPMDVDRIFKGKGKDGKGKNKGKGKKGKSDSKGSNVWDRGQGHGKGGAYSQQYDNKGSKGKGKGKEKGKDKGKNTRDLQHITCHKCWKQGHFARDCPMNEKVRNILQEDASSTPANANAASPSASNPAPSSSASAATNSVRRVQHEALPRQTLIFDLDSDDLTVNSTQFVRMVAVETFFIGDDSGHFDTCDGITEHCLLEEKSTSRSSSFDICFADYEIEECKAFPGLGDRQWRPSLTRKPQELSVRGISMDEVEIILDSGSDATVLPLVYAKSGHGVASDAKLRDAQGGHIQTFGCREIQFELESDDGSLLVLKDKGHVSASVEQPLISYGRLLKRGWVITLVDGAPKLMHLKTGSSVPVSFRRDSLVITGSIRRVEHVRHLPVSIPQTWRNIGSSWSTTAKGFPIRSSPSTTYVDPTSHYPLGEWPFRTTFALDDKSTWNMLEFCEDLREMQDRAVAVESGWKRIITVLTNEALPPEQIGFVAEDIMQTDDAARSSSQGSQGPGLGGAVPHVGQPLQGVSQQQPLPEQVDAEQQTAVQRPELPQRQELVIKDDCIELEGVRVLPTSTIAVLNAACQYLGIKQGGSKSKLWNRINAKVDADRLMVAKEVAQQAQADGERQAVGQPLHSAPNYDEVLAHNLTHLPYRPWCAQCVKGKARPDYHKKDTQRFTKREYPCISFDLCYTGKRVDNALGDVSAEGPHEKLICLVMNDSQTGATGAVPIFHKADLKLMAKSIVKFVHQLSYTTVGLRCDQEPAMLKVQELAFKSLGHLGYRVLIDNPPIRDHSANGLVEGSIHRIRQLATVLQCSVEDQVGMEIPVSHPLMSWSFMHASWLLNRYQVKGGMTPFEVWSGRQYTGKLVEFGEPVLAYTYVVPGPKGGARWQAGIFVGKSETNDMHIVITNNTLRLTRAIKRIYGDWSQQVDLYHQVTVASWMVEIKGNKLQPAVVKTRMAVRPAPMEDEAGTPDEAASDPPSQDEAGGAQDFAEIQIADTMPLSELARREVPQTPKPVTRTPRPLPATPGPIVPATPAIPSAVEESAPMNVDAAAAALGESIQVEEPLAKRPRLNVNTVSGEVYHHVDESIEFEYGEEVDTLDWGDDEELEGEGDMVDQLWFPYSETEPDVTAERLAELDEIADNVEVQRLLKMGVLLEPSTYSGPLASTLSAKFVRSWRKKQVDGEPKWLRRSRLVAREFAFLETRQDTFAPASSATCVRLLPALAMNGALGHDVIIGSFDVSDAYLCVDQEQPRPVRLVDGQAGNYIIAKCLPGQRDGARRWYDYFSKILLTELRAEACLEQPALFKLADQKGLLLLHVDDVLFLVKEDYRQHFEESLKKHFKMSVQFVPRGGGVFEFLKKTFVVEKNYESLTMFTETKHIKQAYDVYTMHNHKPPRLYTTPTVQQQFAVDHTEQLTEKMSGVYRSLVGALLYVSHERADVQYATKSLAAYLKNPTKHSWVMLGRLIGYLKATENYAITMHQTAPNTSVLAKVNGGQGDDKGILLESFSDADWDCRCTSAGVHYVSGNLVYSTSRTQKAISLSSTESEWYAATSTTVDSLHLRHLIQFLLDIVPEHVLRVDNSAVISISTKLGTARLKHIEGKLLWLQQKVSMGVLSLKAVRTYFNPADIGTKGLAKNKHRVMCFLLGFTCDGEPVGEHDFDELSKQIALKNEQKAVVRHIVSGHGMPTKEMIAMLMLAMARAQEFSVQETPCNFEALSLVALFTTLVALAFGWYFTRRRTMASSSDRRAGGQGDNAQRPSGVSGGNDSEHQDGEGHREDDVLTTAYHDAVTTQESKSETEEEFEGEEKNRRYQQATLSEVSSPERWMALHHFESGSNSSDDSATRGVKRSIDDVGEAQRQQWRDEISEACERAQALAVQETIAHNKRKIRIMAIMIIKNFLKGKYADVDKDVIFDSMKHMRGLDKANSTGQHYFVSSLFDSIKEDDLTSRSLVAELGSKMEVPNMTLEEEADYWGFDLAVRDRSLEDEDERKQRYLEATLSEVSSPDYWTEVQGYQNSENEEQDRGEEGQGISESEAEMSQLEDGGGQATAHEAPVLPIDDDSGSVLVPRFFDEGTERTNTGESMQVVLFAQEMDVRRQRLREMAQAAFDAGDFDRVEELERMEDWMTLL